VDTQDTPDYGSNAVCADNEFMRDRDTVLEGDLAGGQVNILALRKLARELYMTRINQTRIGD